MGRVHVVKATTRAFGALQNKDPDTLYFVNDTGSFSPQSMETGGDVYLGDKPLSLQLALSLSGGLRAYYNGNDVTNSSSLSSIVNNAKSHWYGSQSAYNELVNSGGVVTGVLYHIEVQPDWNEDDPTMLGFIKNQPKVMDMELDNHDLKFFYRRYNQVLPYNP